MEPREFYYRHHRHRHEELGAAEKLVPAIVLIAVGAIFLLNNLHLVYTQEIFRYWPAILIAVGMVKLVDSSDSSGRVGGGVLVTLGAFFMARNLGYLDMSLWEMWPLILIAMGLGMLFDRSSHFFFGIKAGNPGSRKEAAVFSGGKRVIADQGFTGCKYDAVFGGWELDLRKADIVGDTAVMDLNAVFGGIEVRVPESWSVVLKGAGVFGAFADNTTQPDPRIYPNPKKVIVKGGAVFAGVEIKN